MLKMWKTTFLYLQQLVKLPTQENYKKPRINRKKYCFQQVGNRCYQHGVESTTLNNVNAFILTSYSHMNCGKFLFPAFFA